MKKNEAILESVNFISEEDLLLRELDKRLSFDMAPVPAMAGKQLWCPTNRPPTTSTCGVRG